MTIPSPSCCLAPSSLPQSHFQELLTMLVASASFSSFSFQTTATAPPSPPSPGSRDTRAPSRSTDSTLAWGITDTGRTTLPCDWNYSCFMGGGHTHLNLLSHLSGYPRVHPCPLCSLQPLAWANHGRPWSHLELFHLSWLTFFSSTSNTNSASAYLEYLVSHLAGCPDSTLATSRIDSVQVTHTKEPSLLPSPLRSPLDRS
jgi:hypothetical protein